MQKEQIDGREFDWFISDMNVNIALCSSAGFGEIPSNVLDGLVETEFPIHQIETLLEILPIIGNSKNEGRGAGTCVEWIELAARGIWIYDWKHWSGPYERIVQPSIAANVKGLNKTLLTKLRVVQLDNFRLEKAASFQVSALGLNC